MRICIGQYYIDIYSFYSLILLTAQLQKWSIGQALTFTLNIMFLEITLIFL